MPSHRIVDRWGGNIYCSSSPTPDADLSAQAPGIDWDFLDGDGMVLVASDHCFLMPSGLHPKSIERYLRLLIVNARSYGAHIPDEMDRFDLLPIANDRAVQEVFSGRGIKNIHLNSEAK